MINLAFFNRVDSATITASSEVASLPAANVAQAWRSKPWRSTGCASEWIKFDFGSAQAVRALVFVGHNLTSGATIKIQANATDAWGSPSIDLALTYHAANVVYLWSSDQTFRYWRITIVDAANPEGFVELGRVFLGQTATPERNYCRWNKEQIDPTTITRSYDGAESFDNRTTYDRLTFEFERILTATFDALAAAVGLKLYFFIIADYDNAVRADGRHDLTRYCRLEELPATSYSHINRDNVTLTVLEAL
jgi:hypothetical protein